MASSGSYCSFPLSGTRACAQQTYYCVTCYGEKNANAPLRVDVLCCHGCISVCHVGHKYEYMGFRNVYCRCGHDACALMRASKTAVEHHKEATSFLPLPFCCTLIVEDANHPRTQADMFECFTMKPSPSKSSLKRLCLKYSRLTFGTSPSRWLSAAQCLGEVALPVGLCPLERFTASVFRFHYKRWLKMNSRNSLNLEEIGAEWWVRVKKASDFACDASEATIGLHYDKDERLFEEFHLLAFPTLSTVTYLTEHGGDASTLVFDHEYMDDLSNKRIGSMLMSRPASDKHIVFPGTKLHGAPGNTLFQDAFVESVSGDRSGGEERITFIVNLWFENRPLVHELSSKHRSALELHHGVEHIADNLEFVSCEVPKFRYKSVQGSDTVITLNYLCSGTVGMDSDSGGEEDGEEEKDDEGDNRLAQYSKDSVEKHDGSLNELVLQVPHVVGLITDTCQIVFDTEHGECPRLVSSPARIGEENLDNTLQDHPSDSDYDRRPRKMPKHM